jgi:hypothetical protein
VSDEKNLPTAAELDVPGRWLERAGFYADREEFRLLSGAFFGDLL